MKNIHLLPTDNPSRLTIRCKTNELMFSYKEFVNQSFHNVMLNINQHIYITSDEEIQLNDWYYNTSINKILQCNSSDINAVNLFKQVKKIILTTDQKLINDGVQPIDDIFLDWFVKNPNCEYVEVNDWLDDNGNIAFDGKLRYQITIPQEQPNDVVLGYKTSLVAQMLDKIELNELKNQFQIKADEALEFNSNIGNFGKSNQETIEQAALRLIPNRTIKTPFGTPQDITPTRERNAFINGAKYQAEKMYNSEEVIQIVEKSKITGLTAEYLLLTEQFKKK